MLSSNNLILGETATAPVIQRATETRANNFNFLRLLFATTVILSHAPILIDGNNDREILFHAIHTTTIGELALDGFFLLSGCLIVQSWQRTPDLPDFIKKRLLRIAPGFIAACLAFAFLFGPLGTSDVRAYFHVFPWKSFLLNTITLGMPHVSTTFDSIPYGSINGPMWTIRYELFCYGVVALFGVCRLLGKRRYWLGLFLLFYFASAGQALSPSLYALFGHIHLMDFHHTAHFLACFSAGGCFALFRDRIRFTRMGAIVAGILLLAGVWRHDTAEFVVPTAGAYLLFYFAYLPVAGLRRFGQRSDISYGVYLYGWPSQMVIVRYFPGLPVAINFVLAVVLSYACGWLSWNLVEKPFMKLKPRSSK